MLSGHRVLVSNGIDGCGNTQNWIARQRHVVPAHALGAKSATSVAWEIVHDGRGSLGAQMPIALVLQLGILTSPDLSARTHHAIKEFTGDTQVGDDLFFGISSPMTANNLGIEMSFKFPALKFAA